MGLESERVPTEAVRQSIVDPKIDRLKSRLGI
jgi:hypothetical protein